MQSVQSGDITEALHIRNVGTIVSDAPSKLMEAFGEGGLSDFSELGLLLVICARALHILVNMMVV